MDIDPEEYKRLFKETFAEWYEEANTAPLPNCFPDEVLMKLKTVFGTYPSWDLIFAALERVISDKELEKTFTADLERLYVDEDSFQWPLDDPHYCLLLGHMRDYLNGFKAKWSEDEDQGEDEDDEADWWKSAE